MGDSQHHHCVRVRRVEPGDLHCSYIHMVISCPTKPVNHCHSSSPRLLWGESWLTSTKDWLLFSQGHFLSLCCIVTFKSVIATTVSPISPFVQCHFTVTLMRCCRNRTLVYIHQLMIKLWYISPLFQEPIDKVKTFGIGATLSHMFTFYQDLSVSFASFDKRY